MNSIPVIINNITNIAWTIFTGLVIIMFMWAGILFLLARGDPSKVTTAKNAVIYALIGVVVGIVGYSATKLIAGIIGVGV